VSIYWKAVEAVTGYPIADLPNFKVDTLRESFMRAETCTGTMTISPADPLAPENWVAASDPFCVALLPIDDNTQAVVGSGLYINGRARTQGDTVTLPLVTGLGYLDRRQTGTPANPTYAPANVDQNTVASQLIALYVAAASAVGLNGMPVSTSIVGAAGTVRTRTYLKTDRKTVLANLLELAGINGGIEFKMTWQHLTSPERWLPVISIGSLIGNPVTAGLNPAVTFDLGGTAAGGNIVDFAYIEDFSDTKGANYVTAWSLTDATTGANLEQAQAYTGNPRQLELDFAWNPSTSITTTADLLVHAQQQLPLMQKGTRSLVLSVKGNQFPQPGVDYDLGDVVRYQIGGKNQEGRDTVPSVPGGISGNTRVLGWQLNPSDASPITTPILGGV